MPITREITITYGGYAVGGSTGRRIKGMHRVEKDFETSVVEFTVVINGSTDAAFNSAIAAIEAAYRKPRQDLTITKNAETLVSLKQSDKTGFDAFPKIVKAGSPADAGLSREYTIRIEFGAPADNISTDGRRWSNRNIDYSPSKQRTITISGTWTATPPATGAFANYHHVTTGIYVYGLAKCDEVDPDASWEIIGEPQVDDGETDNTLNFTIVFKEILHNQKSGTVDDVDIVDPSMLIERHQMSPGDSIGGGLGFSGFSVGPGGVNTGVMEPTNTTSLPVSRPIVTTVTYQCSINKENTKDLKSKYNGTIRPFLIAEAKTQAGLAVILIEERFTPDFYNNRIQAVLQFISYPSAISEQKIKVMDLTVTGKILWPVWDGDPYSFYEIPGPPTRTRTYQEERKQTANTPDPAAIVDSLVKDISAIPEIADSDKWMLVSRQPTAVAMKQGLVGAKTQFIAEVTIETVLQYRKRKKPSVANAGGVTGAGIT